MKKTIVLVFIFSMLLHGCRMSYSFNGASIDYTLTKTIALHQFLNQAPMVYATTTQTFNEKMKDVFVRNTKLKITDVNPDLEIEGEITRYDTTPQAVKDDAYASLARLTMTVKMRYKNNKKPTEDKEETFTAYRDYDSSKTLSDVQEELDKQLAEEIVDQIFNATMSNW